jgi:hypothetical protein
MIALATKGCFLPEYLDPSNVTEWNSLSVKEYEKLIHPNDPCSIVDVDYASEIDLVEYSNVEEHEDWWRLHGISNSEWEVMINRLSVKLQRDGFVKKEVSDNRTLREQGIPGNWPIPNSMPQWWNIDRLKDHIFCFEKVEIVGPKERSFAWAVIFKENKKEVLIVRWDRDYDWIH